MVAVSPAKYDYPSYAYSIVVLLERTGAREWKRIGYQLLDPRWDTQGLIVIEDKLILMHHEHKHTPNITMYDINEFFQENPKGAFYSEPLVSMEVRRPVGIEHSGKKICVSYMKAGHTSRGVNIYDYDQLIAGDTSQDMKIDLDELVGGGHSPSDCAFYNHSLIISNHFSADISILDLTQNPPTVKKIPNGKSTGLYYPLGLAVSDNRLYVGDHIHYFISVFDISDLNNINLVGHFGGVHSAIQMPYHMQVYDNALYVANLVEPQSISAYALDAKGSVKPLYVLAKSKDTLLNAPSDFEIFRY